MQKYKNIFVAATSQHVGKTTSTLGLVSTFMKKGLKVGYCKPVGQKFLDIQNLRVDKDTILFADLINFEIIPEMHSPVILGPGATEIYIDHPDDFNLDEIIINAEKKLSKENEIVIYEGTGHPGVGSVANVSNAKVARLLNAEVIMIVEGGVGSTIDMLNMTTALFREEGVPILGVIVNKVIPEKMDKVQYYVEKWLKAHNLPLLGLMPYEKKLAYPLIKTVAEAVNGFVTYNADYVDNKVESIIAGSLIDLKELKSSEDLLLVVATRSINEAIKKIELMVQNHGIRNCPLSGIVATGEGQIDKHTIKYIEKNNLPLIRTELDTYGSFLRISKIEVKINRSTPWKIKMAIDLIENNIDLDRILELSLLRD
ncbi:MAG: AAA family ATPase [Saprospiraceae bacterium]|jgi:dethiobiotin synthetase|nr:AAA family ATPase [Saprospiraceae bacterium]MBP6448680.1 AAA family ATPase [Saprospiraceae bacterium]